MIVNNLNLRSMCWKTFNPRKWDRATSYW